jgi:hypothetical protein
MVSRMRAYVSALALGVVLVITGAPAALADDPSGAAAIRKVIGAAWDKPNAPVEIDPVVIDGDNAIAGWTQGDRGGRALLKRSGSAWRVLVCGGDALKTADALEQTGIAENDAEHLVSKLETSEAGVPAERRKQFSLFEGMMQVDQAADNPHGHH